MSRFVLYVDGACSGNPGPGGWAVVSLNPQRVWASGRKDWTTNNEMELKAIGVALSFVPEIALEQDVEKVVIVSDSQWAVHMALNQWRARTHLELVRIVRSVLSTFKEGRIEIKWTRAHQGDIGNESADREAQKAMFQLL